MHDCMKCHFEWIPFHDWSDVRMCAHSSARLSGYRQGLVCEKPVIPSCVKVDVFSGSWRNVVATAEVIERFRLGSHVMKERFSARGLTCFFVISSGWLSCFLFVLLASVLLLCTDILINSTPHNFGSGVSETCAAITSMPWEVLPVLTGRGRDRR